MKSKLSKVLTIILVTISICGGILIQGCAMEKRRPATPSEVLIMDLNNKPEYQELLSGQPQTCGMRSGWVYLKPGETCGQHSTDDHEEMLIFMAGKGVALIGEEQIPHEIGVGKVCYIPPYTTHNNKNTGTEPLIYIYCVTPVAGLEEESEHDHEEHH